MGLADRMVGTLVRAVTGAKSLSGSYPTFGLSAGLIAISPESPKKNMAIGPRFGDEVGRNATSGARHVLDDERLAKLAGKPIGKDARHHVWIASRAGWHD
jgi:hypothetical protein